MSVTCTFFGHRDCPQEIRSSLKEAVVELIREHHAVRFYVGDSGSFDVYCRSVLKELGAEYYVVLSRLPKKSREYEDYSDTILPEGIAEKGPPRFAVDRRNRWMLERSDFVICYVKRSFGGAAKFAAIAERRGKTVIHLHPHDHTGSIPVNPKLHLF